MSSDQIAYLRDLAVSYFNEGNLSASVSTWEQVLAIDPANTEARQGITLAQMKMQGVSPDSGGADDADATMMFHPSDAPFGAAPASPAAAPFDADRTMLFGGAPAEAPGPFGAPAGPFAAPPPPPGPSGGFDADRTMLFGGAAAPAPAGPFAAPTPPPAPSGGFDADRTMLFGGAAPPAPAGPFAAPTPPPAPSGGFDADRTMLFAPGAAPPAPPPPAAPASGGFDADRTMVFNPSLAPPPAPAAPTIQPPAAPTFQPPAAPTFQPPAPTPGWQPPSLPTAPPSAAAPSGSDWLKPMAPVQPESDMTMMSPEPEGESDMPPPPSPFLSPSAPSRPSKALEDFSLPGPPPGLTPPPSAGLGPPPGMGALPPPPSSGFSFELPPPPAKSGGLPALPSLGLSAPPPTFAPPPPVMAPPAPKKPSAQFGEVDPGEVESLAVPTVAPPKQSEAGAEDAKAREERLKKEYENQYGRSTSPSSTAAIPRPSSVPSKPAVSRKVAYTLLVVLAVVLAGGYFAIQWLASSEPEYVPPQAEKDPHSGLTKEQVDSQVSLKLAEADKAQREGRLADAERLIREARDIALKNKYPVPQRVELKGTEIERDKQYQEAFLRAVHQFCVEDYPKANIAFMDLERQRSDKPEAGKYIERIFWNAAVELLQAKQPWEATYYLENLVQRNPKDSEGQRMLAYASQFQPGDELGDAYLRVVDPLSTRMAGCK